MKTLIIGNGEGVFKKENGRVIDTFDCVVRMGSCKMKGYEKYIGTKTDVYRTSWDRLICNKTRDYSKSYKLIPIPFNFNEILFLEQDPDMFFETIIANDNRYFNMLHKKFFIDISFPEKVFKSNTQRILHDSCLQLFKNQYKFNSCSYLSIKDRIMAFCAVNPCLKEERIVIPSSGLLTLFHFLSVRPKDMIYITGFDGFRTKYYWRDNETYFTGHSSFREQMAIKKLLKEKRIYEL